MQFKKTSSSHQSALSSRKEPIIVDAGGCRHGLHSQDPPFMVVVLKKPQPQDSMSLTAHVAAFLLLPLLREKTRLPTLNSYLAIYVMLWTIYFLLSLPSLNFCQVRRLSPSPSTLYTPISSLSLLPTARYISLIMLTRARSPPPRAAGGRSRLLLLLLPMSSYNEEGTSKLCPAVGAARWRICQRSAMGRFTKLQGERRHF